MDHCASAGCAVRYSTCHQRAVDHFRRGPCLAACGRCQQRCVDEDGQRTCLRRCVGRACTAEEVEHCSWEGTHFGLDSDDEDAEAP